MLTLFGSKTCPIGIDLGGNSLKMLQLAKDGAGLALVAAAQAEVPRHLRGDGRALHEWYITAIKNLLSSKPFKGRKAVTCIPSREMLIQHLRLAPMDEDHLKKALPWEAQEKVPFNTQDALLRHMVVGEIYEDNENKQEVILMAASQAVVRRHLNLIERTKIEIDSVNVEPCALVNGFAHLLGTPQQSGGATVLIDLAHTSSKVVIAQGTKVVFARTIHIGARQIREAICKKLDIGYDQAVQRHRNLQVTEPAQSERNSKVTKSMSLDQSRLEADSTAAATAQQCPARPADSDVLEAVAEPLENLTEEIRSCIRYHNLVFSSRPAARVIFLGGQAQNTLLCQRLAQGLGLPAQLGDPLARVSASSLIGKHSDLVPHRRSCEWAVVFGLSMGGLQENRGE